MIAAAVMLFVVILNVGWAVVGDVSRAYVQLAIQEWAELAQFVQDDEDRRPLSLGLGDDLCEARSRCCVDSSHRLVHDEQLGSAHEGACDEDALGLPARQNVEGEWARWAMPTRSRADMAFAVSPGSAHRRRGPSRPDRTTSIALALIAPPEEMRWGT